MKKRSLFIVVAMVLLLAVVLGMGGTTFAKYITSKDVPVDSATVAKWGYVITADAADLFNDASATNTQVTWDDENNTIDVRATDEGTDLVAPGTSGSMTFSIAGTAEVAARVTVDLAKDGEGNSLNKTVSLTSYHDVAGNQDITANYEPIKWTIKLARNGGAATEVLSYGDGTGDKTWTTGNATFAQVLAYLDQLDADYVPGDVVNDVYTISWAWAFTGQNDTYDTVLGDYAAGETDNYTTVVASKDVALGFSIQVEQIQVTYQAPVVTP